MAVRLFEDQDHAADYLKYRVTPNEVVSHIMELLRKRMALPAKLAVDVGCGSGQGTVLLAPYFNQVVGTDISPAQLQYARKCDNVTYKQCPAEELPFESGSVDLVTSMTAAHWFDRPRFLQEVGRVLRGGGCVALLSYTLNMHLESGDLTDKLKPVCMEFYADLLSYRDPHIGSSSMQLYKDMFNLWPHPDKEWHEVLEVRRATTVNGYIGLVETFSSYQKCKKENPQKAQEMSNRIRNKLLDVLQVSSPETEVTVVIKYFYWVGCKP